MKNDNERITNLAEMPTGTKCMIINVNGSGKLRNRLMEMGFVKGESVTVIKNAPLLDPVEYQVMQARVSLRRNEAEKIKVALLDAEISTSQDYNSTITEEVISQTIKEKSNIITVALIGNPNCGKTSFFNHATGLREKVGNYCGVTVDLKVGTFYHNGYTIRLVDLPGTYSLTEYSPEERYVREYLTKNNPDMVLNIVDASNLERNLFLTTQLIDMNLKIVMALNMYDELEFKGDKFDYQSISKMLGFPIVPTTASKGIGIKNVLQTIIDVYEDKNDVIKNIKINYENNDESGRYAFIREILKKTYQKGEKGKRWSAYRADNILTNKLLGFPILIFFLWIMFQATFTIGAYPQEWIELGINWLEEIIGSLLPEGILHDLIVDGIIAGVGGVLVFLPNILILFFFISILEDTGYMARAAFIMDKLMHKIGLHGKSFIPFIIGFGCSVPAIMATRTLENRKDRIVTILVTPFMSCSARLPVYLLFVSAFFNRNQGLILLSIYLIGIIFAILTALLLNKTSFKGLSEEFVMELPPYRIPTGRNTLIHCWDKSVQYLQKMATVILASSIIIWALEYFPRSSEETLQIAQQIENVQDNSMLSNEEKEELTVNLEHEQAALQSENSYIGKFGHFIEPVVRPLGYDWRLGVSLVTGIAAKEVVVSTMAVLFHADNEEDSESLKEQLKIETWTSGSKAGQTLFSPLVAYGFMVFVLLCTPCMAALAAIKREAGTKWALFSVIYSTALAWFVSFLIYQIGIFF